MRLGLHQPVETTHVVSMHVTSVTWSSGSGAIGPPTQIVLREFVLREFVLREFVLRRFSRDNSTGTMPPKKRTTAMNKDLTFKSAGTTAPKRVRKAKARDPRMCEEVELVVTPDQLAAAREYSQSKEKKSLSGENTEVVCERDTKSRSRSSTEAAAPSSTRSRC